MKALDRLEVMKALGISDWEELAPFLKALGISDLRNESAVTAAIKRQFAGLRTPLPKRAEQKYPALEWLKDFRDTEHELNAIWKQIERPATRYLLALANMGDSKEELQKLRSLISPTYDIAQEDDRQILKLRSEIRLFWAEVEKERNHEGLTGSHGDSAKTSVILNNWWKHYNLGDNHGYLVFWQTGRFFPTQRNFRGVIARILVDNSRYLAICPTCKQRFIKSRDDQKNCVSTDCKKKANRERQQKFQKNKSLSAHKSGKRTQS